MDEIRTLWWDRPSGDLRYIDQTLLPGEYRIRPCADPENLVLAIKTLAIRGAPALGVAGAYGVALVAKACRALGHDEALSRIIAGAAGVASARPTAVNLSWGVGQVLSQLEMVAGGDGADLYLAAISAADKVASADLQTCKDLGGCGATLLPGHCTVLTHCNAGALACSGWGTALGVVRSAVTAGKQVQVIACETRPLLQGARLTAWELARDHIPVTVIPDSAAAYLMARGEIDAVIVGADRITSDAVFNKIGTYSHAVNARHHGIPFYVAAPASTFDWQLSACSVVVEERRRDEVTGFFGRETVPASVPVRNYAFDQTPLDLVTAIITEHGVFSLPGDAEKMRAATGGRS
ncbi:S-methyl-5-thioribose-1-phosphate isomerase [Methanosphaerula palustris]|uniref:Putative methylthioribose-1-phosphate isomerase n=1 Tax=Methanosphaerula palustris (strain ATCC BAA-1556 / DSM 19958 / E1-9c) TaxID=521011 RepID=B8GF08_METPE|nr:S-methyl-5-thioribose-1-phosphate isomerase [Methanosphaerula palustris]ACL17814.1 translation initiation factor, aIF-2BI family [Methanosphaerula palustris E1-9c]